jgi:hypothetical protein
MVILWLVVSVGVFDHYRQSPVRIRGHPSELAITLTSLEDGGYLASVHPYNFGEVNLKSAALLLAAFGDVRSLRLSSCHSLTSMDGLQGLTGLETLDLSNSFPLTSLQGLQSLVALDLSGLVQGLEKLTQLRSLRWQNVSDLSELPSLPALKEFDLSHSRSRRERLSDFEPLSRLPALEVVYTFGFTDEQVAEIRELLPDVTLDDSRFRKYRYPPPENLPTRTE